VFFGEAIPSDALSASFQAMERTDCLIVIGTTGEVYPAAELPRQAKRNGAFILEINPEPSAFTFSLTDLYLPLPATKALSRIEENLR
jgi:NAD-dependent deacetylase